MLMVGMLKSVFAQNKDLKDQRNLMDSICQFWLNSHNQIRFILNENVQEVKNQRETKLKGAYRKPINKEIIDDKFDLFDGVDYSVSSSMLSSTSKDDSFSSLITDSKESKSFNPSNKIRLFRKAAIAIIAANRLLYLYNLNKNANISVYDSNEVNHKFLLANTAKKNVKLESISVCNQTKTSRTKNSHKNADKSNMNGIFEWFCSSTDNDQLKKLNEISNELNQFLFIDESKIFF